MQMQAQATQQVPTVKKGESLQDWLKRSVPVLVEGYGKSQSQASALATQAWMQINGNDPAAEQGGDPGDTPDAWGEDAGGDGAAPVKAMWGDDEEDSADGFDWEDQQDQWGQPLVNVADGEELEVEGKPGGDPSGWYTKRLGEYAQLLSGMLLDDEEIDEGQRKMLDAAADMLISLLGEQFGKLKSDPQPAKPEGETTPKPAEAQKPAPKTDQKTDQPPANDAPPAQEDNAPPAKEDAPPGKKKNPFAANKAATLVSLFESEIHLHFTNLADSLRRDGHLTRAERIALSGCIGDALTAFIATAEADLSEAVLYRSPWAEVGKDVPLMPQTEGSVGDVAQKGDDIPDLWGDDDFGTTKNKKMALDDAEEDTVEGEPDDAATDAAAGGEEDTPAEEAPVMSDAEEDNAEGEPDDSAADAAAGGEEDDEEGDPEAEGDGKPASKALGGLVSELGTAVKALGDNRFGGYLMLWGDPKQADLEGEYFTPETDEMTVVFEATKALPVVFHHAKDNALKSTVIGLIDTMKPDDVGMWVEAQVKNAKAYRQYVQPLLKQGLLGWSAGALPGSKKAAGDGRLLRWATVEGSLTPSPMDYRQVEVPIEEIKSLFLDAGLNWDEHWQ